MKRIYKGKSRCYGVYKIENSVNKKYFIGLTKISFKITAHRQIKLLNQSRHPNRYLQNSWNKWGSKNFTFVVLEALETKNVEPNYLDKYKTDNCFDLEKELENKIRNRDIKNIFVFENPEQNHCSGIYKISFSCDKSVYIGSARNFKERWRGHKSKLINGIHKNQNLQHWFTKSIETNGKIVFSILEYVYNKPDILSVEQEWIQRHLNEGYNILNIDLEPTKKSNITTCINKKISNYRIGKKYEDIFGVISAKQMKKKQSEAQRKIWTEEKRKEHSEKFNGENNPFYGKKHSPETKQKLSSLQKNKSLEERLGVEKAKKIKEMLKARTRERMKDSKERNRLGNNIRGKSLEEIYGSEKAKEIKQTRSKRKAKTYNGFCLLSPDGQKITEITNMLQFCKKHNLHDAHLRRLISGKLSSHKGWILLHLQTEQFQ